jgi:hypothetical protein
MPHRSEQVAETVLADPVLPHSSELTSPDVAAGDGVTTRMDGVDDPLVSLSSPTTTALGATSYSEAASVQPSTPSPSLSPIGGAGERTTDSASVRAPTETFIVQCLTLPDGSFAATHALSRCWHAHPKKANKGWRVKQ